MPCHLLSDCHLASCDGCQYDPAKPKLVHRDDGQGFRLNICPSCSHPQHVGDFCPMLLGTDPALAVACGCSPEKAIKDDTGKAAGWRLLAWDVLPEVLEVYRYGIKKGYLKDSWRNVDPERYEDALARHMAAHLSGEVRDPESGLRHIAHAAWNTLAIMALRKA